MRAMGIPERKPIGDLPVGEALSPAPAIAQFEQIGGQSIDRILQAVRQHLGTEIAFVSRFVENHEKVLTHIDSDLDLPMGPGHRDSRDDSYCWHIAEGRLPQLIQDAADYPLTQEIPITHALPVGCHLNVPLKLTDGTVYGSFCCLSRQADRSMNDRDLGVLKAFATLAVEQIERDLETSERHSATASSIRHVIDNQSFQILQQPIVDLVTCKPMGAECLSRFPDASERGPDKWFAEAAQVGLGLELELAAIEAGLKTIHHMPRDCYISVNASPETVLSGKLEDHLSLYEGRNIVVELTEHDEVQDFDALKHALSRIKSYARIAIDDVGAGYSGLRHLVDLEPDLLKLDMSLTRDIHKDVARQALTSAMVVFARDIGAKLVAEGIECEQERETLVKLGVDYGQGYFFALPMPVVANAQFMMGVES